MKKTMLLVTNLALIIFSATAAQPNPPNVQFQWQYFGPLTNGPVFRVYGTTNLSQSITNWPVVATWTNWSTITSGTNTFLANSLYLAPSAYFFTMTASNSFWGEAPFSIPVATPPPAISPVGVSLIYFGQ